MILDLKPLFRGETDSLPLDLTFDFSQVTIGGVCPLSEPVHLGGKVVSRAEVVSVDAVITAKFTANCDRCGCAVTHEHQVPITRAIVTELHNEDNDELIVSEDMKLDLEELALSELVLNLPMKHLCREDCKGICQKCGANLNDGECGCDTREVDPRLSALLELLKQ